MLCHSSSSSSSSSQKVYVLCRVVMVLHCAGVQALRPYGIGVATGEHCHNRIMFKQFLQSGAMQYCQIDSCRLAGPNEILSVYLMAAKFNGQHIVR